MTTAASRAAHWLPHPGPRCPAVPARARLPRCASGRAGWTSRPPPPAPASGILKGFDPLLNLVLDGTIEHMRDPDDQYKLTEDTRQLGLVVCRGTSVVLICPQDGMEAIPNPFVQQQDA